MVRFEDVYATSLAVVLGSEDPSPSNVVGYTLWHRKAKDTDYPTEPTCTLLVPNTRFVITGLSPATEYFFKVLSTNDVRREIGMFEVQCCTRDKDPNCSVVERSQSLTTNCSSLSNPSSVEDETNHNATCGDQIINREDNYLSYRDDTDKIVSSIVSNGVITCIGASGGATSDAVPLLDEEHAMQVVTLPSSDVHKCHNNHLPDYQIVDEISTDNRSETPVQTGLECVPFVGNSDASLPITPCKLEIIKEVQGRHARSKSSNKDLLNGTGKGDEAQDARTSKKGSGERQDDECMANGHSDGDFEYYVKVIRWLECEGHIEKNFRQKFLTWYSLRASPQELRVVKAFVDTLIQDPASLAEQLMDTFSECISCKRSSLVPSGFCMRLWH